MNKFVSHKTIILLIFLVVSVLTLYAKLISPAHNPKRPEVLNEKFDEKLSSINSLSKLDSLVRKQFESSGHDTVKTLLFMDEFFRERFYHSYSEITLRENWIAYLSGKTFWTHFLFPVVPADIIKYPMAGCSQQGMLFLQQLNSLKIPSASLQFYPKDEATSGHYAVTAYYGNSWHYFDPNLEPVIIDSTMPDIGEIIQRGIYNDMYNKKMHKNFKEYFINKHYKRVDEKPFHIGNMYYFQIISHFLSNWLWLMLLIVYLLLNFKNRKRAEIPIVGLEHPVQREHV